MAWRLRLRAEQLAEQLGRAGARRRAKERPAERRAGCEPPVQHAERRRAAEEAAKGAVHGGCRLFVCATASMSWSS